MTATRRALLAGLGAAALPRIGWAAAGGPAYLAAAKEAGGGYALYGLDAGLGRTFRVPLPERGHAAAAHPRDPVAVAFARRPGTFALVLDCADGRVMRRLDAPPGRHFYGHGAFLDGGRVLATTENAYGTGDGRLGLWDAAHDYARLGEIATHGIGPHEIVRLPGTGILAVANGGLRTHPDTGRAVLNLPTMRPSLAYLDGDGRLVDRVELPRALRRHSIRHLAVAADETLAFAMQSQDGAGIGPLLGLHRIGSAPRLLADGGEAQPAMMGYAGSVAFSGDGARVAITGPKGGRAQVWDVASGTVETLERTDVCGVATAADGFVFTDGGGGVHASAGSGRRFPVAWDNHLVALV